ncbi:MAG: AraC family transcriptional regulator ligand-binding domain-containing protein [Acidobacteriota bacterium]
MRYAPLFTVPPGWRVLLKDLGISEANVLRRAELPGDLFSRDQVLLKTPEFFRLWKGIEEEAADPELPLRIGESISVETFDAPIFAALCSPNFNVAVQRLSQYKRLIGPMALDVEVGPTTTAVELRWVGELQLEESLEAPESLVAMELVFFVALLRLATRELVHPLMVESPCALQPAESYRNYFGCEVSTGTNIRVVVSAQDAARPFLTSNETMWNFFQPELRKRLSKLESGAELSERVRGALLELLPAGDGSLLAVAKKLAVSQRTLQRRLKSEGLTFRQVLDATRHELARHYLSSSRLTGSEISFLLGFDDPHSFSRAFQGWTGQTPEQVRGELQPVN